MKDMLYAPCTLLLLAAAAGCAPTGEAGPADVLLSGGSIYDGAGGDPFVADVVVSGRRIVLVGDARESGSEARDTLDVSGLIVAPGFVDMHSHAELDESWGWDAQPYLYQGITTVVLGVDGGGEPETAERLGAWREHGIGVNGLTYVGHNAVRRRVMGMDDREPTATELAEMKALVKEGMEGGALGLSSGLFYLPGNYAETEEVIALNRVAAEYGNAIYDTHDRDLGAAYPSFGYLNSIREGIRIGEEGRTKVIFSHFNAQGAANYGRAPEGAGLIEAARARGVEVAGAQHVYTATQSNLRSYTIPGWAVAGGDTAMIRRFDHPDTVGLIDRQSREMLEIRGGAEKLLFGDPRPELNGKTLQDVADAWGMSPTRAARRILRDGNAVVMNLDLYDPWNTRYLAQKAWMMTCTDGRTPRPEQRVVHPRVYGAFTKKLRDLVLDEGVIALPFAIRSMTGLAADFLGWSDRGYLRQGMYADIAVLDPERIQDRATFQAPHRFSQGTVHVLVNGVFALRDGKATGELAGLPLMRVGAVYGAARR